MRQRQNLKRNCGSIVRRFRFSRNFRLTPLYSSIGGLRGALGAQFPGPYEILWEPTLTGIVVSDIWRPPTYVGTPGILAPTAIAASPPLSCAALPPLLATPPRKLAIEPAILY